ncbi:nucleotide sugar dehydrogenase [Candidatus Marinamargulisbacteria bacterium SCGC AAA071-K20]|nr:nucleotide sugar dehydrogenase [Candidatus Marinamargulisbacteria bacterium SCGC AAA071-K20]
MSALPSNIKIAVIGLGYVGLPLVVEFSKHFPVIAFDISQEKVTQLSNGTDITGEVESEALNKCTAQFTATPNSISEANIIIVTVPTPIDSNKKPDLTPLKMASTTIGQQIKKGSIIIFESTVYPGVSEEICAPIIEKESGLKFGTEFELGYSPERISPGDKERSLTKITKIVSGSSPETLELLSTLYGKIITAGIHKAPSIKVAEAAKVIENTQRDLNVALMNELSIIFNKMDINALDVIEAAATKWNFMKMTPGLVGGHCIGVDPYYLTYKAEQLNHFPEVILAGRRINDSMGKYVAEQTVKQLIKADKQVRGSKVLIMGITFKENVPDIRNSKVIDIVHELQDYGINVIVSDPVASTKATEKEYSIKLQPLDEINEVAAIIVATPHSEYSKLSLETLCSKINNGDTKKVFIDIKGLFKSQKDTVKDIIYWTL